MDWQEKLLGLIEGDELMIKTDLNLEYPKSPWLTRLFIHLSTIRVVTRICLPLVTRLDLFLLGISGGRVSTGFLFGCSIGLVTTIGARTGLSRTIPLLCISDGDNLLLVASNGGSHRHPAWYYNLKAFPHGIRVQLGKTSRTYDAQEVSKEERERLWPQILQIYPGYDKYRKYANNRYIPVSRLIPEIN